MGTSAALRLRRIGRYPGLRVLAWAHGALYAGRRYDLLRWDPRQAIWHPVAAYDPGPRRRLTSATRLGARLFRDGLHALAGLPDGTIVAVLPRMIARLRPGDARLQPVFEVPRGTRPLAITATPDGRLFWGEYFRNPGREPVHIYGSTDGTSWEAVYTFPARSIRHIHSITYDPFEGCLWVLTGDEGPESRIIRAGLDWTSLDTVVAGTQQARAVTLVVRPEAIYFATDSPWEQNYIYRLDRTGRLGRLAPIAGSCFWSCGVGGALFFSTAVEPSPVNRSLMATLYGSPDGWHWTPVLEWPRDRWPSGLFQYANIILPAGDNPTALLAATGLAVCREDQATTLWEVHQDA